MTGGFSRMLPPSYTPSPHTPISEYIFENLHHRQTADLERELLKVARSVH
jgi:hypothetical protein